MSHAPATLAVTAPSERLDASSGARLASSMKNRIARDGAEPVLDLRAVRSFDDDAIRAIIKVVRALHGVGRRLRVIVEDAAALGVLRSMALDRVFGVYPTLEALH